MARAKRGRMPQLLLAAAFALAAVVVVVIVIAAGDEGRGPVPIVWDRETCAYCGMHISEPAFAAQLKADDGSVESFDDPGCLFRYLDERRPAVRELWFHHYRDDRWISGDDVAFVETEPTPMGYGLGAVDKGTPGSLSLDEAKRRVLARAATEGERP